MTDNDSQFDEQSFKERLFNDHDLIKEITAIFLEDTPIHISEMKAYAEKESLEEVKKSAHKIKGAAANMSADKLHLIAREIELDGQHSDSDTLLKNISALEESYKRLEIDLTTFLKKL